MKIKFIFRTIKMLILGLSFLTGCKTVETGTQPTVFQFSFSTSSYSKAYQIVQFDEGQWIEVQPEAINLYTVKIPMLRGGYSQFLFFKYNQHNPKDYEILGLQKDGKLIKTFTLKDLENLPEKNGIRELK